MSDRIDIRVNGLAELEAQLRQFGPEIAGKRIRTALRAAAEPMEQKMLQLVPEDSGELKKAIGRKAVIYKGDATSKSAGRALAHHAPGAVALVQVGVIKKSKANWRAHLAEFGTQYAAPQPFLRPALDQTYGQVLQLFKTKLAAAVQRLMRQRAKGKI